MTQKMVLFLNINAFRRQHIIIFAFIFAFPFVYVGSYFFPLLSFGVFGLFQTSSFFSLPKKYVVHETDNVFQTYTKTINSFDLNMGVLGANCSNRYPKNLYDKTITADNVIEKPSLSIS